MGRPYSLISTPMRMVLTPGPPARLRLVSSRSMSSTRRARPKGLSAPLPRTICTRYSPSRATALMSSWHMVARVILPVMSATPFLPKRSQAASIASFANVSGLLGWSYTRAWKRKPTGPTTLVSTILSHFLTYSSSMASLRLRARRASRLRNMSALALALMVLQPWVRRLTWAAA